jgi:predicted RNase H-like HicB family nuclease
MKAKDRRFHIRLEVEDDGSYTVSVPELPGCVSCGDSVDEALDMIKDAMSAWLASAAKHNDPVPPVFCKFLERTKVEA